MQQLSIINYLIEKGEFKVPSKFLKTDFLLKLEKELSNESLIPVAKRLSKLYFVVSKNIENYFCIVDFSKMINNINKKSKKLNKKFPNLLSDFDLEIIDYLVDCSIMPLEDLLEISGPLFHLDNILTELKDKKNKLSDVLIMSIYCWLFANFYELLLYQIDRRLYAKFKDKSNSGELKKFIKKPRDFFDHASAGLIFNVFNELIDSKNKNCLFSSESELKNIRNKVSHLNLFYDGDSRKIIILGSNEYTKEEFMKQFYQLTLFFTIWLNKSIEKQVKSKNLKKELVKELSEYFGLISKVFFKINRSIQKRQHLDNLIIIWKKEASKHN